MSAPLPREARLGNCLATATTSFLSRAKAMSALLPRGARLGNCLAMATTSLLRRAKAMSALRPRKTRPENCLATATTSLLRRAKAMSAPLPRPKNLGKASSTRSSMTCFLHTVVTPLRAKTGVGSTPSRHRPLPARRDHLRSSDWRSPRVACIPCRASMAAPQAEAPLRCPQLPGERNMSGLTAACRSPDKPTAIMHALELGALLLVAICNSSNSNSNNNNNR